MTIEMHPDTLRDIFYSLCLVEDINSAHAVFYKAGKTLGPKVCTNLKELPDIIEKMGWGTLKVKKNKDQFKFELKNSLFSGMESEKGVCALYAGMFSAILAKSEKVQAVVVERNCVGKGNPSCVFESIGQ